MFSIPPSETLEIKSPVLQYLKLCQSEFVSEHLKVEEFVITQVMWLTMKTWIEKFLSALRIAHMHHALKISITDST